MFKRLSPTTIIGWLRFFTAAAICGKPVYLFYTVPNYNAIAGCAGAAAVTALINGAWSALGGHFTADAPPYPPAPGQPLPPPPRDPKP